MPRRPRYRPDDEPLRPPIRFLRATKHCKLCGFYFADIYPLWNRKQDACTLCKPHPDQMEEVVQWTA